MKHTLSAMIFLMMVTFWLSRAIAADEAGHGGNPWVAEFRYRATFVLSILKEENVSAELIAAYERAIKDLESGNKRVALIVADNELLYDKNGDPQTATVSEDLKVISLHLPSWIRDLKEAKISNPNRLVAHEIFELEGLDRNHEITSKIAGLNESEHLEAKFLDWFRKKYNGAKPLSVGLVKPLIVEESIYGEDFVYDKGNEKDARRKAAASYKVACENWKKQTGDTFSAYGTKVNRLYCSPTPSDFIVLDIKNRGDKSAYSSVDVAVRAMSTGYAVIYIDGIVHDATEKIGHSTQYYCPRSWDYNNDPGSTKCVVEALNLTGISAMETCQQWKDSFQADLGQDIVAVKCKWKIRSNPFDWTDDEVYVNYDLIGTYYFKVPE